MKTRRERTTITAMFLWRAVTGIAKIGTDIVSCVPGPVGWVGIGLRTGLDFISPPSKEEEEEEERQTELRRIESIPTAQLASGAHHLGNCATAMYQGVSGTGKVVKNLVRPGANHAKAATKLVNKATHVVNAGRGAASAAGKIASNSTFVVGMVVNGIQLAHDTKDFFKDLFD